MATKIEWTQTVWNPTTGCTKVSQGCKLCYAEVMHKRLTGMGQAKYQKPFREVVTHPDTLETPFGWKTPKLVFVNSMSDLFHEEVPLDFIQRVFNVMNNLPWHTFQVLTKRDERLAAFSPLLEWTPNIWMGVSVENEKVMGRIDKLRKTGAHIKFLSCEPLIGPLPGLDLTGIDWCIVGGESGRNPRSMHENWVEDIRLNCEATNTAFFFKQWGGKNKKAAGRLLNGRTYDGMPVPY